VEPDPEKALLLGDMGFDEGYSTVALQLATNLIDEGSSLVGSMKGRSQVLYNTRTRLHTRHQTLLCRSI